MLAALARTQRHGLDRLPGPAEIQIAQQAVDLAAAAHDASALANAKLAEHDAMWVPGTAARRLPVIAEMLDAARPAVMPTWWPKHTCCAPRPCWSSASQTAAVSCSVT